jgi:hypothetical protein
MGSVVETIFGGTDDSAQRAQAGANQETQAYIDQRAQQAREDLLRLFPESQRQQQQGFSAALDVLRGAIPQQMQLSEQGSMRAQQQLGSGSEQFRNAIMGLPVDFQTMQQPSSMPVNLDWLNVPQFMQQQAAQPVAAPAAQAAAPVATERPGIAELLGGQSRRLPGRFAGRMMER